MLESYLMNHQTRIAWFIGLLAGLFACTFQVIGLDWSFYPGDLGDGRLNLYFLEHGFQFLSGNVQSYWDAPFMHPEPNVIAYSDNLLGTLPVYAAFRFVGMELFSAYQWWYLALSVLNYGCAFLLFKHLFKNPWAAALGAFVFAFSVSMFSQVSHSQTFARFPIPLAFLMAVRYSEQYQVKYFCYALLLLAFQIYCGIYLGFLLAIPLGIFLAFCLLKGILRDRKKVLNPKHIVLLGLSSILSILVLLPLIYPYTQRKIEPDPSHYQSIVHSIPEIQSYFISHPGTIFWNFLSHSPQGMEAWWDHQLFVGIIAFLCMAIAPILVAYQFAKQTWNRDKMLILILLISTGIITGLIFLKINNHTLYKWIYYLPGFSAMRSLTRIINIEILFFGLAVSYVATFMLNKKETRNVLVFSTLLMLLVLDNFVSAKNIQREKIQTAKARIDAITPHLQKIPANSVISYEPDTINAPMYAYQIDAMLVAQQMGMRTLNAYTATSPTEYSMFWKNPNSASRNYWLSKNEIDFDTLYVVRSATRLDKIPASALRAFNPASEERKLVEIQMNIMRQDTKWIQSIEAKAKERGITLDSMLYLDAKWLLDQDKP